MSATVRQRLLAVSLLVGLAAGTHAETNPSGALPDVERPVAAYEQRRLTVIRARSVEAAANAVTRVGGEVQFRLSARFERNSPKSRSTRCSVMCGSSG